jgi:hypothetical protein
MKVRFQADADFNQDIVQTVRRRVPEIDFQTAYEANFTGLDDESVLERAAQEDRVIVSQEQKIMPRHFADFILPISCPVVLIIPPYLPVAAVVEDLFSSGSLSKPKSR